MVDPPVPRQSFLSHVRLQSSPQEALRDGDTIRLTVISIKGRRAILSNDTLRISARNDAGLRRGDSVFVIVRKASIGMRLEIDRRGASQNRSGNVQLDLYSRFVRAQGLPPSETGRSIFEAFIASSRTLSPQLYNAVRSRLSNSERRSLVRGELELVDRGVGIDRKDSNDLDELRSWLSGDGSDARGRGEHRKGRYEGDESRSGRVVAEGDLLEGLKTFLHRRTDEPSHPLQLFNALLPMTGTTHWVVLPLRFFYNKEMVEGVLKIGMDVSTRSTHTAILSIERPAGRWWFEWSVGKSLVLERFGCEGENQRPPDGLLAKLGGTRHTTVAHRGDGFGIDPPEAIDGGVDRYG